MQERYYCHTLSNGMTLLGECMPGVQSASMTLMLEAGASNDPAGQCGAAAVLTDLTLRGAGSRDSRELTDTLDRLGLQRSNYAGLIHTRFGCAATAARVMESLPLYADVIRQPHLPEDGFEAERDLSLQSLASVDDDPRQKLMIQLRKWHYPGPLGRCTLGEREDLTKLTVDNVRTEFRRRYQPHGAILAMAGNIDFEQLRQSVEESFGDWQGEAPVPLEEGVTPGAVFFDHQATEQTHIGLAWPSVDEASPDYYPTRLAIEVLSGGMSCRLFTEVREKRGLVYSVWAGYSGLKGRASILGYAGTGADRAQATLDCFIQEVYRLTDGVTSDEVERARIGVKAATIMQGESTIARAGAIAHDFYLRGRIRTLDEIKAAIDAVTVDQVNDCLKRNTPGPFTIVAVGPADLKVPTGTKLADGTIA